MCIAFTEMHVDKNEKSKLLKKEKQNKITTTQVQYRRLLQTQRIYLQFNGPQLSLSHSLKRLRQINRKELRPPSIDICAIILSQIPSFSPSTHGTWEIEGKIRQVGCSWRSPGLWWHLLLGCTDDRRPRWQLRWRGPPRRSTEKCTCRQQSSHWPITRHFVWCWCVQATNPSKCVIAHAPWFSNLISHQLNWLRRIWEGQKTT